MGSAMRASGTEGGGRPGGRSSSSLALSGAVIRLDAPRQGRDPDDLDGLIDDLFPDVDERPGWFDVGLVVVGAGLLAWTVLTDAPGVLRVLGVLALALGCILPVRSAWRRGRQRRLRRRRESLLATGVPVDVSSPTTRRLVDAYDELLALGGTHDVGGPAVAAAHSAVLETATLLGGRPPAPGSECDYVDRRTAAVLDLASALRALPTPSTAPEAPVLHPGAVVEAREELDHIAGFSSVSRLEELAQEARMLRRGHD